MYFEINYLHFLREEYLKEVEVKLLRRCRFFMQAQDSYECVVEMHVPNTDDLTRHKLSKLLFRLLKELLLENLRQRVLVLKFLGENDGYYVNDLVNLLFVFNNEKSLISSLTIANEHKYNQQMRLNETFKNSKLEDFHDLNSRISLNPSNMPLLNHININIKDILSFNTACENSKSVTVSIDGKLTGSFTKYYIVEELTIYTPLKLDETHDMIENFDERVRIEIIPEVTRC